MTHFTQKTCRWLLIFALLTAACVPSSSKQGQKSIPSPTFMVPVPQPTPTSLAAIPTAENLSVKPVFKTSMGDLAIESVRWVEEVNGVLPGPGEKLLLITIGKPSQGKLDPNNFSLQDFDRVLRDQTSGEVHLAGNKDVYVVCSMAGWVGDHEKIFAMGFRVPENAEKLQLFWPGNAPIDLHPEN
jgi:hypothetical protein